MIKNKSDKWFFQRRPWGWMIKLWHSKRVWIKILSIKGRTSLQYHNHREEYHLSFFSFRHVKRKEEHRMETGLYLEIATGRPREDDNIRINDDYGRT